MNFYKLWFHEVLQITVIRQITKGNEDIEKIEKYSQKPLELCTNPARAQTQEHNSNGFWLYLFYFFDFFIALCYLPDDCF